MVRYTKTKIYLYVEPVFRIGIILISVADPDPGSGAFLTPGSGIRDRKNPDPRSGMEKIQVQDPG